MYEFFMVLFFGKTLLLTPVGVDVDSYTKISLDEHPVMAINSGAQIQIQVPEILNVKTSSPVDRISLIESIFPSDSLRANIVSSNGESFVLDVQSVSVSADDSRICLSSSSGVPTNTEYNTILLYSKISIKGAKVYWKNHGQ